jgi:hypothetical protein
MAAPELDAAEPLEAKALDLLTSGQVVLVPFGDPDGEGDFGFNLGFNLPQPTPLDVAAVEWLANNPGKLQISLSSGGHTLGPVPLTIDRATVTRRRRRYEWRRLDTGMWRRALLRRRPRLPMSAPVAARRPRERRSRRVARTVGSRGDPPREPDLDRLIAQAQPMLRLSAHLARRAGARRAA